MSKFYGTVKGDSAKTYGTRRGYHELSAVAQSHEFSLGITLKDNPESSTDHIIELYYEIDETTNSPECKLFEGSFEELLAIFGRTE